MLDIYNQGAFEIQKVIGHTTTDGHSTTDGHAATEIMEREEGNSNNHAMLGEKNV